MKKKGCIVVNGTIKDFEFHKEIISQCDFILAADGASNELLKMGVLPDCIVGDMDSIKKEVFEHFQSRGIEILKYPEKKDKTDTELAIDIMNERGYQDIIMLGCFGDRVDHMLGNIYLMHYAEQFGIRIEIMDEKNNLFLINKGDTMIKAKKGTIISFLNIGLGGEGLTLEGFEYPLQDFELRLGSSRCISNIAIQDNPVIHLKQGALLGIITSEKE